MRGVQKCHSEICLYFALFARRVRGQESDKGKHVKYLREGNSGLGLVLKGGNGKGREWPVRFPLAHSTEEKVKTGFVWPVNSSRLIYVIGG